MKCREDGEYCVHSLRMQEHTAGTVFHGVVESVEVLGTDEPPRWSRDESGLHVSTGFRADGPVVFKVPLN